MPSAGLFNISNPMKTKKECTRKYIDQQQEQKIIGIFTRNLMHNPDNKKIPAPKELCDLIY